MWITCFLGFGNRQPLRRCSQTIGFRHHHRSTTWDPTAYVLAAFHAISSHVASNFTRISTQSSTYAAYVMAINSLKWIMEAKHEQRMGWPKGDWHSISNYSSTSPIPSSLVKSSQWVKSWWLFCLWVRHGSGTVIYFSLLFTCLSCHTEQKKKGSYQKRSYQKCQAKANWSYPR